MTKEARDVARKVENRRKSENKKTEPTENEQILNQLETIESVLKEIRDLQK